MTVARVVVKRGVEREGAGSWESSSLEGVLVGGIVKQVFQRGMDLCVSICPSFLSLFFFLSSNLGRIILRRQRLLVLGSMHNTLSLLNSPSKETRSDQENKQEGEETEAVFAEFAGASLHVVGVARAGCVDEA